MRQRLYDWRSRLAAETVRQAREPFAWGEHDCAIGFGAGVVKALTGVDVAAPYRGHYRTPTGAMRLLRKAGFQSLGDFVASLFPEIEIAQARIGDLGVVATDGPIAEAICMFDASGVVVMTEQGHGRLPRDAAFRAFRVGD